MTRSSESRAQRASRRGATNNAASGSSKSDNSASHDNNEDEREQAARQVDRGSHRRRSSWKKQKNKTAAAAAARAPSRGRGAEEGDVLLSLVKLLQQGAPQVNEGGGSEGSGIHIDLQKASNVLEAAAGNMALAANLYWDDYFATQATNQLESEAADPHSESKSKAKRSHSKSDDDHDLDQKPAAEAVARGGDRKQKQHGDSGGRDQFGANENRRQLSQRPIHLEGDSPTPSKRRLRRSLDSDFQAADDDDETKKKKRAQKRARKSSNKMANNGQDSNDEADEDEQKMPAIRRNGDQEDMNREIEARPQSRRRSNRRQLDDRDSEGSDNNEDQEVGNKNKERVRRRRARRPTRIGEPRIALQQVDIETSISVSDDELGKVGCRKNSKGRKPPSRRRDRDSSRKLKNDDVSRSAVMKAANDIHHKLNRKGILSKTSTWFLSPEQREKRRAPDDDDSVNTNSEDYICNDDWLRISGTDQVPMEYVWGAAHDYYTIDPYEEENEDTKGGGGNVVLDDDAMNVSGEEEDGVENNKPSFKSVPLLVEGPEFRGIPYTWLNAGFQMSECGSGLVINSPTVEDVEFFAWRQTQVNDKRNAVPPPHHCKSLTAITSIVTGLLYTGASIQGDEVNFTSGKKPWSSLTVEQRKREFESRLTDALSSLIFVAAQASLKYKKKAHRKAMRTGQPTNNAEDNYSDLLRKAIAVRKGPLAGILDDDELLDGIRSAKESDDRDGSINTKNGSAVVEDHVWKDRYRGSPNHEIIPDPTIERAIWLNDQALKERMRQRLELIPTCVWADKKDVVKPRAGDGGCFFNIDTRLKVSWTNIRDIKLYVGSNLRAFTEKGGIALFLETLLRIHGDKFIGRQLKRCAAATASVSVTGKRVEDKDAHLIPELGKRGEIICKGKTAAPFSVYAAGYPSLIRCTCEDRQRRMHEENPLPLNVRVDPSKLLDMTPSGTGCVSVELLTLILTGRMSSDWKDCSSEKLGIGILTENVGEVGHGLARPQKPVWLIKGEACYSMLNIDGSWIGDSGKNGCRSQSGYANGLSHGDDLKTISRVDKPNASLNLCHWNGWYGQRSKTEMRLVNPKPRMEVPSIKLLDQISELPKCTNTQSSIMRRRRYEYAINAISSEEHVSNESKGKEAPIRHVELDRINIHLEDQKLYPNRHKMWRFDLGENADDELDTKPPAQSWIPYFQLTSRQKRLVETKLGPKINTILWTRWPEAVIDNFTPSEGGFPIV